VAVPVEQVIKILVVVEELVDLELELDSL